MRRKMKRILSTICTLIIMLSIIMINNTDVGATNKDVSALTTEVSSTGTTELGITSRGAHLMDGQCSITKTGTGKIYVYAATSANHVVDYISTTIYVERYNESTGRWGQIDSWEVEDYDTYFIGTNKTKNVNRGYYYRVRANHIAGMRADQPYDEATSYTDGIWIG